MPILTKKRETNDWKAISLQTIHVQSCIKWLINRFSDNTKNNKHKELSHIYVNEEKVTSEFQSNHPLFAVVIKNKICIVCKSKNVNEYKSCLILLQFEAIDTDGISGNGCWFSPIIINETKIYGIINREELEKLVQFHVLMLPWMNTGNKLNNLYYIISDDWKERNSDGNFKHYWIDPNFFDEWK